MSKPQGLCLKMCISSTILLCRRPYNNCDITKLNNIIVFFKWREGYPLKSWGSPKEFWVHRSEYHNIFILSNCKCVHCISRLSLLKIIHIFGTSLVVQWLRIHLPVQGTWVWSLVREDPTCRGATKPVRHNYWACALEPASHNYWAHVP